jgi:O-antigen ligase
MPDTLADNYLFVLVGAVFLVFLPYLMFVFYKFIPHVLVTTYFGLPLVYKLANLKPLPLTTVFTLLFGPIVLFRARKAALIYLWPIAYYLVLVVVSSVINDVSIIENKSALIPIVIAVLCMLSFSSEQDASERLKGFTYLIIAWIVVNSLFSILQILEGKSFYLISVAEGTSVGQIQRGYGLIGMATQVGINFCMGVPLIGSFLFQKDRKKVFLFIIFAVSLAGLFLSFSRGAILGVFVSLLFLLLLHRRIKLLIICIILAVILVVTYTGITTLLPGKYSHFLLAKDDSARGRFPFVQIGLRMFADHPIAGFGYGGFYEKCIRYGSPIKIEAHNTYIQVLVEYGILGLLAFLLTIGLSALGYIGYIQRGRSPTMRTLGIGYFAAMVALLINALVHCMEWNLIFWLVVIFGLLMRHYLALERHEQLNTLSDRS